MSTTILKVNTEKSVIKWAGDKIIGSGHKGTILVKEGEIHVNDSAVSAAKIVIDMETMEEVGAGSAEYAAQLIGHLKSDDFFKTQKFPTSTIAVKSIQGNTVKADLTILDKTNEITFDATINVGEHTEVNAKISINRTDWGIVYGSGSFFDLLKDQTIKDTIDFEVSILAN
jgi:polyisoprenoid-binding protein YceI